MFQLILQRKLGRVVEEESGEKEEEEEVERDALVTVTDKSSKLSLDRTNDDQLSNTELEALPKASKSPKHEKVGREASHKIQALVERSTPPEKRKVMRVSSGSGTRLGLGSKVSSLSRQGSAENGAKRLSKAKLRVSTSFDYQHKRTSLAVYRTVSTGYETEEEGNMYYSISRPEWGFDQIAMESDNESELDFFDAKGTYIYVCMYRGTYLYYTVALI